MTDEQIKQNAEKCADGFIADSIFKRYLRDTYIAGAHSRDEEIKELKRKNVEYFQSMEYWQKRARKLYIRRIKQGEQMKELRDELDKLCNPWRDAKKELPEMTEETREYKESPAVFICFDDDTVGVAYYSYSWKRWESRGAGIPTPKYWMPISKLPKGGEV